MKNKYQGVHKDVPTNDSFFEKRKKKQTRPTGIKGAILHFLWRLGIGGKPNHVTWESQYK